MLPCRAALSIGFNTTGRWTLDTQPTHRIKLEKNEWKIHCFDSCVAIFVRIMRKWSNKKQNIDFDSKSHMQNMTRCSFRRKPSLTFSIFVIKYHELQLSNLCACVCNGTSFLTFFRDHCRNTNASRFSHYRSY